MDREFGIIYVDLSSDGVLNCPTDSNGAPVCAYYSGIDPSIIPGTEDTPLSFDQFWKHVNYRLTMSNEDVGKSIEYRIRGSVDATIKFNLMSKDIFSLRDNSPSAGWTHVKFRSWDDNNVPYKLRISTHQRSSFIDKVFAEEVLANQNPDLNLFFMDGCKLTIENMIFESGVATSTNFGTINTVRDIGIVRIRTNGETYGIGDLTLINSRFFLINNGSFIVGANNSTSDFQSINYKSCAITFEEFFKLSIINSMIWAKNGGGVEIIDPKYTDIQTYEYNILGSIFIASRVCRVLKYYRHDSGAGGSHLTSNLSTFGFKYEYLAGSGGNPSKYVYDSEVSFDKYNTHVYNSVFYSSKLGHYSFGLSNGIVTEKMLSNNNLTYESLTYTDDGFVGVLPYDTSQYGFIPSMSIPLGDDNLNMELFNYLSSNWNSITVSDTFKIRDYPIDDPKVLVSFGRRDGIGPLWFKSMENVSLSLSPMVCSVGDEITLDFEDAELFHNTHLPKSYVWCISENSLTYKKCTDVYTSIPTIKPKLTVSLLGVIPISLKIVSHNSWYYIKPTQTIKSKIKLLNSMATIKLYKRISTGGWDEAPQSVVLYNEECMIGVNIHADIAQYISDVSIDVGDIGGIPNRLGNDYKWKYTYKSIGEKVITAIISTTFGDKFYIEKIITVNSSSKTWYVDLSKDYEDITPPTLNYSIYEDFEDLKITTAFSEEFISYCEDSIKNVSDEYVAYSNDNASNLKVFSGIGVGAFNAECSMVRNNVSSNIGWTLDFNDHYFDTISTFWDAKNDQLVIYDYTITPNTPTKKYIKYGTFNKDPNCKGFLNKIGVRYISTDGEHIKMQYSINFKDWVDSGFEIYRSYTSIDVMAEFSHSGGISNSGYGYIKIEFDKTILDIIHGDILVLGSQKRPFTFTEFYNRVVIGGSGVIFDEYMCRGYRLVSRDFRIDGDKRFKIDAWYNHEDFPELPRQRFYFGPWMLIFGNNCAIVDLSGAILSNGIIYNISSRFQIQLYITHTYNMFIVWNGKSWNFNRIWITPQISLIDGEKYNSNIIGSTIRCDNGYRTSNWGRNE